MGDGRTAGRLAALFGFYDFSDSIIGLVQLLLHWNLMMGLFNLLPVFPMDGGRIFRALLATRLPYLRATYWAATIGKVLAVIAGLISALLFHNYLTAFLFAFIYAAGDAEYRAVQRRELQDAQWRAMANRLYPVRPAVDEPPILGHKAARFGNHSDEVAEMPGFPRCGSNGALRGCARPRPSSWGAMGFATWVWNPACKARIRSSDLRERRQRRRRDKRARPGA